MAAQPFFQYLPSEPGMESLYQSQQQGVPYAPGSGVDSPGYMPGEPGMQGLMSPRQAPPMPAPRGRDPNSKLGLGARLGLGAPFGLNPRQAALMKLMDLAQKRRGAVSPQDQAILDEFRGRAQQNYDRQSGMASEAGLINDLQGRGLMDPGEQGWVI